MLNTLKTALLSLALVFAGASNGAGSLSDTYPADFDREGIITGTANGQQVLINATRYMLDSNVRVHTPETEYATPYMLTAGKEVGFTLIEDRAGSQNRIKEIWVLPKGSVTLN